MYKNTQRAAEPELAGRHAHMHKPAESVPSRWNSRPLTSALRVQLCAHDNGAVRLSSGCVDTHSEEKVKRAGTRIAHTGPCVRVCAFQGPHIVAVMTPVIVVHLDLWVHVSLQPDPRRL